MAESKPDLDSPQAIHDMVRAFYHRLLADPAMRRVFLETAEVDLQTHLPIIEAYWRKMLLGEKGSYTRHMIRQHENVHDIDALKPEHFRRWGACFHEVLDERFQGPNADRAHQVADRVLANLQEWLLQRRSLACPSETTASDVRIKKPRQKAGQNREGGKDRKGLKRA